MQLMHTRPVFVVNCTRDEALQLPDPSHRLEYGDIGDTLRLEFDRTPANAVALRMAGITQPIQLNN